MNSTVRFTGYYGEGGSGMLQFKVMGPLEVLHDGRDRTPTPPKVRQVLAMWTGPCLANVVPGRLLEAHAVHLEEQRMRALELRIQADAEIGLHRDLVGEMRSLVMSHPLNEWFHGQLIVALSRSGRRGEALQAYQNLRELLCNQLGLEPQPDLQLLQREVLSNGIPESAVFRPYRRRLAAVAAA